MKQTLLAAVTHPRRLVLGVLAVLALTVGTFAVLPQTSASQNRYSLKLNNRSKFDIYHLQVSSTEEDEWGPDQLGDTVLEAGTSFTLTNIKPGEYDIRVIDEDGDKCVLNNVKIFEDSHWDITTARLLQCEGFH